MDVSFYKQVQEIDPNKIDASSWNELCKFGSIYRHAQDVLFACEKVVELAPNEPSYLDSRGLARALTGNIQGAIDDFQAYVDSTWVDANYPHSRKQWIQLLKKGENPFTDEVLEDLKHE